MYGLALCTTAAVDSVIGCNGTGSWKAAAVKSLEWSQIDFTLYNETFAGRASNCLLQALQQLPAFFGTLYTGPRADQA